MTHHTFTIKGLLIEGWNKTKDNFWFLIIVMGIYALVAMVTFTIPIIGNIASMLLGMALITVTLVIASGKTPKYEDLTLSIKNFTLVLNYFLATLLYGLIVLLGLVAFILPGIYLATRLQFYMYALIDNSSLGPVESIKKSWGMTQGVFWKLFLFGIASVMIIIISALPLGLGLLFSVPTIGIAYAMLYKKLNQQSGHAHAEGHHVHVS